MNTGIFEMKKSRVKGKNTLPIVLLCAVVILFIISLLVFRLHEGDYVLANLNDLNNENSPEFLAKESGDMMIDALAGKITAEELFENTVKYSAASMEDLQKEKSSFISSLNQSKTYFDQNGMSLQKILYSETDYLDDEWACIRRIHRYNTGKQYYFCQYYKKVDGQWKISTDTLENDFKLKQKHILWYFTV